MEKIKIVAVNVTIIAVICTALIWGETYHRQRIQFARGEDAFARRDYIAAISGYESAIHMYTPGSSIVQKSAGILWKMGEELERGGDMERALIAYRSLRSSFYAVRGFSIRGREWIAQCDGKIFALTNGSEGKSTKKTQTN